MSTVNKATEKKGKGAGCLRWFGRVVLGFFILFLALAAAGAIYQAVASAREAKAYKPVDQMVDVNGIEMRLDCRGSGSPTVVLEAGGQTSSLAWRWVQDDVAKFTRVCSYDRAGYGWSEAVDEPMFPGQVVRMLHDLLEKGGEKPPYLMVGHSIGGIFVRTFAAEYPDAVVGMVLVDSTHDNNLNQNPPELAESPEYRQIMKSLISNLQILVIAEPIGLLRMIKAWDPMSVLYKFSEEDKAPVLAMHYRNGYAGAYLREAQVINTYSGQLRQLGDIPLIVLSRNKVKEDVQKEYEMFPQTIQALLTTEVLQKIVDTYNSNQMEYAALSTHGKWIIVQDTGHFIQIDQPQVVIDAIREVFEQATQRE